MGVSAEFLPEFDSEMSATRPDLRTDSGGQTGLETARQVDAAWPLGGTHC